MTQTTKNKEQGSFTVTPSAIKPWLILLAGVIGASGGSVGIQHLIPALAPDKEVRQEQVDSAVRDMMERTVLSTKESIMRDMNQCMDKMKADLKENISDKLEAVKTAVNGLQALTLARMDSSKKEREGLQSQVNTLRKAVQSIEEELEAGIKMAPLIFEGDAGPTP